MVVWGRSLTLTRPRLAKPKRALAHMGTGVLDRPCPANPRLLLGVGIASAMPAPSPQLCHPSMKTGSKISYIEATV
jgi:hypothetical protein